MVLALRVLFYLVSIAFIVIVLIQPDRSHGMSGSGGGANSLFGVAQDGGPLAKITMYLGVAFLVIALLQYVMQ
jgi:preprotein translocase subunit SecG